MLRDDDPPNEQYLKRPSTQELVQKVLNILQELISYTKFKSILNQDPIQSHNHETLENYDANPDSTKHSVISEIELLANFHSGMLLFKFQNNILRARIYLVDFTILYNLI